MDKSNTNHMQAQMAFDLNLSPEMGSNDFMVSECNKEAFMMVNAWPQWLENGLYLYGPEGCGKTHLAHLFADKVQKLTQNPLKVPLINAEQINMLNVARIANENTCLVIENLSSKIHNEAMFHLFNMIKEKNGYILWTAQNPPNRLMLKLPDLSSRLNMLPAVQIKQPDDLMVRMLAVKLFNDKQLTISEEILNYIIIHSQRSFAYILDLVTEIDKISLARKMAVNHKIVAQAIESLNNRSQNEPDLFSIAK